MDNQIAREEIARIIRRHTHHSSETIADAIIGAGYGKVEQYQEEIERLKVDNTRLKELDDKFKAYYKDLDSLSKRLQDDYAGDKPFEQLEEDRLALCGILDCIDEDEQRTIQSIRISGGIAPDTLPDELIINGQKYRKVENAPYVISGTAEKK